MYFNHFYNWPQVIASVYINVGMKSRGSFKNRKVRPLNGKKSKHGICELHTYKNRMVKIQY